jgi:hypothetical protein
LNFEKVKEVKAFLEPLMRGFDAPWCVAGGWAIDLWLAEVSRSHADLEIAVLRRDQQKLWEHFKGWSMEKIVDGKREKWNGEELVLPVHEIHGRYVELPERKLESLLDEAAENRWAFRRDASISLPIARAMIMSESGLPVLAPEIVLLFKSKSPRAKDEQDFLSARSRLDAEQSSWLRNALSICDRNHSWIDQLSVV